MQAKQRLSSLTNNGSPFVHFFQLELTLQQEGTSRNLAIRAVAMPKYVFFCSLLIIFVTCMFKTETKSSLSSLFQPVAAVSWYMQFLHLHHLLQKTNKQTNPAVERFEPKSFPCLPCHSCFSPLVLHYMVLNDMITNLDE